MSIIAELSGGGDFFGGKMTVNQTGVSKKFPLHYSPKAINSLVYSQSKKLDNEFKRLKLCIIKVYAFGSTFC